MLYATLICLDSITHARMYRLHQAPTGDTATTRTRSARCGVSARAVRPRLARVRARRRVQVHCEFWARARHPPRTSTPGACMLIPARPCLGEIQLTYSNLTISR